MEPLRALGEIITTAFEKHQFVPRNADPFTPKRTYTPDEIVKEVKGFILPMIGSWTTQHSYNWKCEDAKLEEDVEGDVKQWRRNADGTMKLMLLSLIHI